MTELQKARQQERERQLQTAAYMRERGYIRLCCAKCGLFFWTPKEKPSRTCTHCWPHYGELEEEQERGGFRCVGGCYTVQWEAGDAYPSYWQEDSDVIGWRWVLSVGYFTLAALCYPTRQEALDYIYTQA